VYLSDRLTINLLVIVHPSSVADVVGSDDGVVSVVDYAQLPSLSPQVSDCCCTEV
jgi:hypothetical protein